MMTEPQIDNFSDLGATQEQRLQWQGDAEQVASSIRLSFRAQTWRGASGAWQGVGIGSSIDFQDHRQYLPGDDPRYINWQAYARTGHMTMKLYREEVSPQVDLVLDVSKSMFVTKVKLRRVLELFHFIVSSAKFSGANLRSYQVSSSEIAYLDPELIQSARWVPLTVGDSAEQVSGQPLLHSIPWRQHAMRIVISDLLFEGEPKITLGQWTSGGARFLLFVPFCQEEREPDWLGNVELRNCEKNEKREMRFTDQELRDYKRRYAQHFTLWQESCARRAHGWARVDSEVSLQEALLGEPLANGLVELWN